jgi:hypothetical protein
MAENALRDAAIKARMVIADELENLLDSACQPGTKGTPDELRMMDRGLRPYVKRYRQIIAELDAALKQSAS